MRREVQPSTRREREARNGYFGNTGNHFAGTSESSTFVSHDRYCIFISSSRSFRLEGMLRDSKPVSLPTPSLNKIQYTYLLTSPIALDINALSLTDQYCAFYLSRCHGRMSHAPSGEAGMGNKGLGASFTVRAAQLDAHIFIFSD